MKKTPAADTKEIENMPLTNLLDRYARELTKSAWVKRVFESEKTAHVVSQTLQLTSTLRRNINRQREKIARTLSLATAQDVESLRNEIDRLKAKLNKRSN